MACVVLSGIMKLDTVNSIHIDSCYLIDFKGFLISNFIASVLLFVAVVWS